MILTAFHVLALIWFGCVTLIAVAVTVAVVHSCVLVWRKQERASTRIDTTSDGSGYLTHTLGFNPKPKPRDLRTHSDMKPTRPS